MTTLEARNLCAVTRYPDGWHVEARCVRKFRYRDKVALVAFHDSMPVMGWSGYDVPGGLAFLLRRIERENTDSLAGLTVTTDEAGWIRSIEKGVA